MEPQPKQNLNTTFNQSNLFQASISPVTNSQLPFISTQKDKDDFAAYKNFVNSIEIKHNLQSHYQNKNIDHQIQQLQKQFQSTEQKKPSNNLKNKKQSKNNKEQEKNKEQKNHANQFKFTQFIENKNLSRNKVKTASSCTNFRKTTKNQLFKISHVPTANKFTTQEKTKKNLSPQQLKGRPYIDKKPKRLLVLKDQKENSPKEQLKNNQLNLKVKKLPQLKSEPSQEIKQIDKLRIQDFKDVQNIIKKKKLQKLKGDISYSPILKTFQPRYFGLDNKTTNFQIMGRQLLDHIRSKYWCFESIENEQVYENFEHFLCSNIHK